MWWMLVEQLTQKVSNLLLHSPSQQYQLKGIATLGKATRGYDPSVDIEWLRSEIVRWVLGNLMQKWYDTIPLWPFFRFLPRCLWSYAGDLSREDMLRQVSQCRVAANLSKRIDRGHRIDGCGDITRPILRIRKYIGDSCALSG